MWDSLRRYLFAPSCVGCHAPGTLLCPACAPPTGDRIVDAVHGLHVRACGAYDGPLRRAILALKAGERAALDALAPLLAALLDDGDAHVALVPVPTTWWRANRRGFDQGVALARRAGRLHAAEVAPVLRRRGLAQHGATRLRRLATQERFILRAGDRPRTALLIDDVCTTGASLRDAATVLAAAGVSVRGALVLARTPEGREVEPPRLPRVS